MHRLGRIFTLAVASLLTCNGELYAQGGSTSQFGTQGPVGQIGSNLTGSIVGQGTTLGSPTLGGTGGGTGSQLFGGTQLGGTQLGNTTGQFVGRNDNAGGFVGDQRVGQQTGPTGNQRQFGNTGTGRANQSRFGNQARTRGQAQTQRAVIRPRQEIAFQFPDRDLSIIPREVTGRIGRIQQRNRSLQGIAIEINPEGIATLTGTVADEDAKKLAGILVGTRTRCPEGGERAGLVHR